jgi:hypothetical protein
MRYVQEATGKSLSTQNVLPHAIQGLSLLGEMRRIEASVLQMHKEGIEVPWL